MRQRRATSHLSDKMGEEFQVGIMGVFTSEVDPPYGWSLPHNPHLEFSLLREEIIMGLIKKAVENQQKSQALSVVALGVSIFALICVFAVIGATHAHRE